MIRATAGTWANYATTLVFQILFAAHFGATPAASAFVIAFAIAIAASGVFVTTTLSVFVPRLLTPSGQLSARAARAMLALGGVAIMIAGTITVVALFAPGVAATVLGLDAAVASRLMVIAAVLLVTLAAAGMLGVVALARGHRFLPALAPALPTTAGAVYLVVANEPNIVDALLSMTAGAIAQAGLAGYLAGRDWPGLVESRPLRTRATALGFLALLLALSAIIPLQRAVANAADSAGAAQFDYAARGLQVAIQLLIGGIVLSSVPDWSRLRGNPAELRAEVARRTALAGLLLAVAASVMLVAVEPIVRLVLQRGEFLPTDTAAVSLLVRLLLAGFVAEGVATVLSLALLAARFSRTYLQIGTVRLVIHAGLTLILGLAYGPVGVAAAYSIGLTVTLLLTGLACRRVGLLSGHAAILARSTLAAVLTASLAIGLMVAGVEWEILAGVIVIAGAVAISLLMRLGELLPPRFARRIHPGLGSNA